MKKIFDLRSDTVTKPTQQMREAMANAEVGDDVLQEDPTINRLENLAANLLGKEAALFVPSGTFGNQLAIFVHCRPGDEIVLAEESHVIQHEAGATAIISGANLRAISVGQDYFTWDEIKTRIRWEKDIHFPQTSLIELENALSNGNVMPLEVMKEIYDNAKQAGIKVHLDGARIFNAAHYLNIDVQELAANADSIMFCLSKGLGAPVGSILTGTKEFIDTARNKRKILGGGMRQAGVLAAAGIIGLEEIRPKLSEDHQKAKQLAECFGHYSDHFEVDLDKVKINMFFVRMKKEKLNPFQFIELLKNEGIVTYPPEDGWIRFVTHFDIPVNSIDEIIDKANKVIKGYIQ
ncbi:MAG: aminotransferase class V-fold PLP-dependent enzyme [Spirochaetes bacterium]|nr:aminotransferase class V-fold PLP-dependent enzyme [Spirochaetota bacterium]